MFSGAYGVANVQDSVPVNNQTVFMINSATKSFTVMKLTSAAELVEQKAHETLTYFAYPSTHWRQIRTNNPLERIIREIRPRTRVVGAFQDGKSALMLVAARLRHIASTKWGKRRYLVMDPLLNPAKQEAAA